MPVPIFSGRDRGRGLALPAPQVYPVESPLPKERLPPEPPIVLEPAEIRWGKSSQFSHSSRKGPHLKYTVNIKWPDKDEEEAEEQETPTLNYNEVEGSRKTSKIRVTSPTDPDMWLEVERIDEITFQGPDSLKDPTLVNKRYVLKHPAATGA